MAQFTLPQAVIDGIMVEVKSAITEMGDICGRVETQRGTQAERSKAAEAELRAAEVSVEPSIMRKFTSIKASGGFSFADSLSALIDTLTAELAEQRESNKGSINAALKAKHADTTTELAGLVAQYDALKAKVTSAETLLGVKVEYPALPKTRSSSSGGTRVASKMGSHYVVEDGNRKVYSNDSFSYLAFKFGVSSDELRKAIAEQGADNIADPWEVTVTLTGTLDSNSHFGKTQTMTIGHAVTPAAPIETPAV